MSLSGKRFVVGLTGGIGSGKSLIADSFAERGVTIVDTDVIAHALTGPDGAAMPAIEAQFGRDFLTSDGSLARASMRKHAFTDTEAKSKLEAILHPLIRLTAEQLVAQAAGVYAMVVVPLLIESGVWRERVSRILAVDCPESLQIARVMQRSGLPEAEVRAILAQQASRQERLATAHDVIVNDGALAAVLPQIDRLHLLYLGLAGETS
jgi:dephospho-CoA kinase